MTRIAAISGAGMAPRRAGRTTGSFILPGDKAEPTAEAAPAAPAALLALQEAPKVDDVAVCAQRRAAAVLAELRGLQLDLLRGSMDSERLARVAALALPQEAVADPLLAELLAQVALRARIELARRHAGAVSSF